MKRILIFSTAYYPFVGGAEVAIKEITDRLVSNLEFDLLTPRLKRSLPTIEKVGAVTVYRIGIGVPLVDKLLSPFIGAITVLQLNAKHHYAAFWAMMATYMSGAAYIANILAFWHPTPIVLTLQEGDSERHIRTRWLGLVGLSWWMALRYAKVVTVISVYLKERTRAYGYKGEVLVIPNGVDVKHFIGPRVSHAGTELITTSRLVDKNGIDVVIRALPLLPAVTFKILGTGPDESKLKALAKELHVEDRVEFVGHVDHSAIPPYLHRADIFVRPSRSEGMGNSFIEAFAAGIPVIATQEGGIADFLFDRVRDPDKPTTGWAVDKDNAAQIAAAVTDILQDSAQTQKVVGNAKKMAEVKYDWDLIAQDMQERVFAIVAA